MPGIHRKPSWIVTCALIALSAAALSARTAAAQRRESPTAFSNVYLQTGTLLIAVNRLNPHLERADLEPKNRPGYFTTSGDGYAIGLGGYGIVRQRLALGAEFVSADMGAESSPAGKMTGLTTSYWLGTVGYSMFTTWRVNFIPFLGIGAGTATLTLRDRAGGPGISASQNPGFDDVIMEPGASSAMKGRYVLVQPGLAFDYIVLPTTTSTMGITFGVRLASAISPNRTTWTYRGQSVFGGPDLGPAGGVVRVTLGFGGFRLGK